MRLHRLFGKKKSKDKEAVVTISKKRRLDFLRKLLSREKDLPPKAMIAGTPEAVEWDFKK